ncbi:MAG: hypothetical protein ACQEQV_09690 [Fibrobacterota bacterium]
MNTSEVYMLLNKESSSAAVELTTPDQLSIRYGIVQFDVSLADCREIARLFDRNEESLPDAHICSVIQMSESMFLFQYRGITLSMCKNALASFGAMVTAGLHEYDRIFNRDRQKSRADIDTLLSSIEKNL